MVAPGTSLLKIYTKFEKKNDQNVGDGLGDGASLGSLEEYFGNFELRQIEAY